MKNIKKILITSFKLFIELKFSVQLLFVLGTFGLFGFVMIEATGQPGFCNSCHIMKPYYANWQSSKHNEVNCLDCHLQPGFIGYVKGKINGMAQSVDCLVGRIGTKPSAVVKDASCLRSECHNTEELLSIDIDYNGIKFTHNKHVSEEIDGIKISCGMCHSHFEGDEHFNINTTVCFTCHFLKNEQSSEKLVQTTCLGCHEVPDKVIERGLVSVNHAEFVSYKADCEDSCHKRQVEQDSHVSDTVCLSCHSYGKEHEEDSEKLHALHSEGEKVECFACHGNILHKTSESSSIAAMMDCQNCHSDTHGIQRNIYEAQTNSEDEKHDRVLSPMFLTHVECIGCHIEQVQKTSGALDSFGKVAKAVPRACDKCHEEGTGEEYVPFWQKKIKKLHEEISEKVDGFENRTKLMSKKSSRKAKAKVAEARDILESVSSDGSWGVHNFKYTEAMLRKANAIIAEAQQE